MFWLGAGGVMTNPSVALLCPFGPFSGQHDSEMNALEDIILQEFPLFLLFWEEDFAIFALYQ